MKSSSIAGASIFLASVFVCSPVNAAGVRQTAPKQESPQQASQAPKSQPGLNYMLVQLEKSGYKYEKVADGVWEISFTGKNVKEIPIRIALADDLVLIMGKLADRKGLSTKEAVLLKVLELNHHFDTVKIALSEDRLYVRIDIHWRLVDVPELKYLLEQVANVVEEVHPQLKPFIEGK